MQPLRHEHCSRAIRRLGEAVLAGTSQADDGARAGDPPTAETGGRAASVDGVIGPADEARVPLLDDGLLRGDGAFEFIRCYRGRAFTLAEHLDRLGRTCATIRLGYPRAQLEAEIAALLAAAGPVDTDLRVVLTRGGRRIVITEPFPPWPPAELALITDEPRAVIAGAKTLSYAGNMLAKRLAAERGFREALLVHGDGRVMEVQQAAVFWVTPEGVLCTPPLADGILDSITRRVVMKHLAVEERTCRTDDILGAQEAFLAGTAREIQPVARIEDRVYQTVPGPATRSATDAYRREVQEQLGIPAAQLWPSD